MLKNGWTVALMLPQVSSPGSQAGAMTFFLSVCMGVGRKHEEEEQEPINSRSHRAPSFHHPVHRSGDCLLYLVNTALGRTRKCSSISPGLCYATLSTLVSWASPVLHCTLKTSESHCLFVPNSEGEEGAMNAAIVVHLCLLSAVIEEGR
jgi:hypothetical protein